MSQLTQIFSDIANSLRSKMGVTTTYKPADIYDVWKDMQNNSDTKQLMINNTACGVCPEGYAQYTGENNHEKEIKEE